MRKGFSKAIVALALGLNFVVAFPAHAVTSFACPSGGGTYEVDGSGVLTGITGTCGGSLTLDSSVLTVAANAFYGDTALTGLVIPNSVTDIGDAAFAGTRIASLTFGNSVATIGRWSFQSTLITSVTFPSSMRTLGSSSFNGAKVSTVNFNDGLTSIGDGSFSWMTNSSALNVVIPDSVTYLGGSAFSQSIMGSVTIGTGVTQIRDGTFYNNFGAGPTSVTINGPITSIGNTAFLGYRGNRFTIPASVTSISTRAFEGSGIQTLVIDSASAITTMGGTLLSNNIFQYGSLSTVIFCGTNSVVQNYPYYGSITPSCVSVPGAPAITSVVAASSTSATITYTAPASNGGGTITSYTATSTPGSITRSVSRAGSGTLSFTGLTNGTTYTFTIYATNAAGNSPLSSASSSFVMTLPVVISSPSAGTSWTGTVGSAFSHSVVSAYGSGARSTSVSSGTLPTGLSLNTSTGVLSGTPTSAGTQIVSFTVTDSGAPSSSATVSNISIVIGDAPKIGTPTPIIGDISQTSATVTFDSVAHASSYTFRLYAADGTTQLRTPSSGFTSDTTLTGLTTSTTYKISITAIAESISYGDSLESTLVSFTTSDPLPPSKFLQLSPPKISQNKTEIICESGKIIFQLNGSGGSPAAPTYQIYVLVAENRSEASIKTLESIARFDKKDLRSGVTYSCSQSLSQEDASDTFTSANYAIERKANENYRTVIKTSRALYWTTVREALYARHKSIDELLSYHRQIQNSLGIDPSLRVTHASESMKQITLKIQDDRDLAMNARQKAEQEALAQRANALETSGVSVTF